MTAESKLRDIRNLVVGVGRVRRGNGIDMLADAVLRILDRDDEPRIEAGMCGEGGPIHNTGWPRPYRCTLPAGHKDHHQSWQNGMLMDWWGGWTR